MFGVLDERALYFRQHKAHPRRRLRERRTATGSGDVMGVTDAHQRKARMVTPKDLVDAQLYTSDDAVIEDAVRHLLRARPDLRISLAIYRYQHEAISLAKAASLAGVSWPQMREIMVERGVTLRLGPESLDEARAEVEALRRVLP